MNNYKLFKNTFFKFQVFSIEDNKNEILGSFPLLCSKHLKSRNSYEKQGLYEGSCDHLDGYSTTYENDNVMHQKTAFEDYNNLELNFDIASKYSNAKNQVFPSVKLQMMSPTTERMDYELIVQQSESKTTLTSSTNISYTSIEGHIIPATLLTEDQTLSKTMINYYNTYPSIKQLANYSKELRNQETNFGYENFPTIKFLLSLQNKNNSISEKERLRDVEHKDVERSKNSHMKVKNLNFKNEIGILEEADYEVQHSSFVKCEARSLELSAIDVGTTSEKKEEVESIDLETSETAVEEKVIAEHCPEIVSSIGGEKMPLLSKTISEDLVTTATDSGELSEGVVREEKSDANERVSEFDSDGFFAEYNEGLQVLNQLESGTKGAHIEDVDTLVSYIEGDAKTKIQTKIRKADKSRSRSRESRKKGSREEAAVHVEERIPPYSVSKMMMHHVALHPEYADAEITEDADDTGFKVVGKRKRKISFRRECVSENVNRSHSEENASEQKSVETSLDELLHERNDMDLGDAHKESIFVQETVQMSKRESPKHHDDCEPRDVVFHDLKESLSEEKSPIVCEITETLENLNFKSEIGILEEADYEVQHSSFVKCEARSLELSAIDVGTTSEKKEEVESIDLETSETAVEEKVIAEHCPEIVSSIGGEKMPLLSKTISEDLVTTATDSGELSEGVVREEKSDANERVSEFDSDGFFAEYNEGLQVLNQLESGTKGAHIEDVDTLVSYIEGDAKTKIQTKIRKADKSRSRSRESRKKGSREEAAVHVEERIPPYSVSKMMMHHVALHPEYADAEITEDADDTGFKVVGKRKRKISFRRECVSENVNRSHSEENASEQKSVETSLDELLHERNDMDLGDAHKESIFVQETVQMSKRESPKHHDDCEPRDVVFHDLKESLSEEKSPIVCEITETLENLNFKSEIGILEEADYEVQHSSFVKCEARSLELSAIDVGTTSEKKEEVESIDLETSETAVEEKVIAEHCPEIVSSIGGEKMPLLSKTISEDLVTTATDSGELSEGVVREEKSDANERVSEFDSDGFFAEYNEGLQVLNQLESGTKGAHIEDVDTLVSYIEGDAKTKIQTKIRKADKSRSRSRESRKKGSREEAAVHVEERIPPYSVSKMMMHHVALHPEYADAEITEDADDTGFKVVGKRKRKISFRRECVSENVNRSHSEENASEQKSVETSLDELLHERNDMDLGDAHKESIFVQETVQMSKRESPKHHDDCEPRDVVFHDLKESLSEEKSPIVCEITETLENLNFKSEIGILEEADYEVQHSSFVKCEARSLELSAIDVGTTSEKKEEVESIDLETSETAVEEKVIAEHCPEIVSSIGGEKMPLLSKTISEDLVTTATDSGELSEGVVREEKSDANERVSEFDSDGFFAEYNEGLQVLNQLESGTKGAHIEDVDTLVSYIEGDAKTKIQTKIRKADKSRSRSRESRKKGSREEAAVHVEERIPPYSVSKMMMHHVALHPEYADAEITEDADDTGFKVVGKRKRKISFRRECVSENVNRSHSEENASEQKSVETSLDELLHERNDMDLGDAHKESIFVQETVQMSKRESPKHHDDCEPRDVVFHDLKESLSEEKSPIVCEITETLENLNFKSEIGILEEADYEVQHSSFVKCEARSLELSAIDVGTTSEKKEEVESIDLETSETAVEEKVIAEHCPEIVSSIGGEKMPLLSKTISEDLVTTATDSGELSEGVVREEKSDANERVSEFDSDGFFAEYNEGLQVLNQLESGTKGAHIEDVDTLVSYIEGDAKTKIQTKIRKADKSRSRSRESRKKGSREEAAVHVEERIPPYSVSKMMMHHVALHPEYADAEITEDADDTGFKVVGKRKRKISFRRECVSENVNRSHSEENASEQKSVETSLDELLHERNDMDLGDAHKESIFVQETVQMSKRESPKHHDDCEPRDVVFHDLKESLSEEKSPIVCEITETLENLNFKSEIGILEEADYEVQHSSFVKCEARSLELSAIDVGTTSEKKEEVESIDLETSETAVEEKVIAEHCPEIVSSIGGEKMPLLSKTISEDLVTTATDSGELSEGVVREEKSDANERVSEFDSDGFFAEYNEGLQVLNQLESGTKGAHIEDVDTLVSYIEGDAKTKIQTKIRKADKSRSRSRESRKKGSREEAAVHVEERIPPYSVSKMMMHHVALHPEYADAEITEDADDTGFKVVGKRKRKISFRRECVSENVNRSHSEENASEQKSVETSLDELLHERNDMDLGDAHKESIFVQETVQMSKRESPKHHDDCEPRDVVFHDLKESLSEEKSPIVCEITETLENLNFKSEIGILEEADYEVQHSSFVKCEARSLELSAIDVGTTSEKKEEVESIDLETSETAVEEKVIAEHCPEIVSSIGGEKMPLLSKTISEDLVTTATDSGELSEGVVREEKSDANERVSEFDSDGFFAEYNEGLQVLNQLESGTKGAHIEDVDTLVSYIEGDAKTKIQTKIRKADKSRSRSRESRKKGSREEAAVHVEERIPPYSVSKMMMHHVALHPEYADAEITEDADDTGFKVVGKRKRKISFRRECVSENVNRSHSEENASEQKSVETSLDELLHERNDMDLGDAHKESIFVQETVQMSKRESPKHHDDCEPRDVVFHDLKESLSEEKSPIVCEITETLENLNFKSEIGILEEADYEVQHSSFVKCEARSLELSAIDVGTTSEKKEEVESIDLETSETAVEEKVIAEHCPEIVSSIGGEKMPLLSKTISEDLVTTATDSGELSEGVVREEKSDANERVSEFDSDGFFAEYNEGLQVLNQLESGTKGAHIEDVDTLVSYIEGDAKTKIQTKIRKADKSRSRSRESRKKGSREEAAVHVEERIPPYSVSKMMMHHVALHPEYADAEITEDADDTGFKVVGKRKRKISFRRECVSENVNRSHSEENASEQKSVETSLDELLHERNDMDLGDAHKESIFVQETVQMSKRESPKHHDDCEPRDVVFHDLKESLSEEKSPIVCEITETLENLNFKSEIGILEEADYEVQHSSFVKCEARSLELSAIDVGTTSEKKEEVESIDLETSETAVEEKVIAEHCPEIVSSIGGEKMPLLSKTISEDLVTTATDSGELSEGVVREEKSDANERVSEFDSDGFFAEYNEGLQVLNQLESGTKGAHIEDVDTLVSYIEGDAKTKIQTKIRKADKSRSRSRESRKKGSREEAAVHVEERIPPYSVSKMMMHHVALHPEYADAEITEDADDTGFKVVGKRKRKISFRRECVSENVNRSHSEENASEQKSVETSLDELLHERNDMDLGDAHKESIFVQETVQMSKRESPKHHDDCEPRDVVFHDLKESLSEEKSPIVCEITETLENLNFKSEIGILEEADYEVQHSSFVKCEARSLELSAIDVGTTSEKKEEVESIDLETSETAVEEKVIAEHCPEIVSSIGGEKMPLLSKTISEDLVTTATDSGELSEGVVREEKSDANERVSEFDSDGFFAEYNEGLQVLNQLESGTKGAHIEDVDTLVSYIEGDAKTKIQTKIRKADKSRSRSRESRKKGSREEAAVHVEERIPPYSVSKMMMHHVALHPEYADAEITEDADDTGFKVVGKRKRKISFRRECVSENVNRSHSEENASEQKSVETSLDELLHERNDMDLGDAHKESIFVQETVQMSKRESPKHHDDCEPRDVVFHDLKESLSEEKSPIVCEITETLENLNFKSEIGILEEADYEVQHSSFVKCEARSLELSAIDVGTTSEKKEEVESIDLETSETAVEEKVIAEHCPEIVSSIGGEKMPLLSKTISEDLVTTATDSGELSEGVVREEKSDANERVSEFDSDGFFAEYNEGLQVLNQLESGTKGAHIEDVDTLVSYIEGDAKTKIQTKIRKADKSRSRSRESRKKGSREEAAVHVEERIPPYSVSKMMMHHVALHPEYADAEITEDADDTGFKVVGKRKRKISFRRECVSENVNRSHSEENASEQKSVETSLDELLHERNDMDLGDAHKESIFVQETVQMSKRESPKHHDDCEPRDVVFHDLKESLSEEKSPIVCEITETLENLNFKSEIGILEEADYEVQHSSFVKCEARSLELSAIDVGTTSEKKEEVESIDLETSETAVEEKVIAEHCPEIVSSIGGEKMPLLSKTISEDLVTTATDSGELSEGVVREEKSDANERVSEFDSDGFFAEYNEGLQVLNQLESGTKGAHIEDVDTLVSYIEGDAKTKIQTKIRKADKSRSRSRESRKKGSREEAAVHVEERIPPYSVSKMMMHHVALHPEYADAEITEDADDTGFKVVGKRKRKISFRRECVSENVNRSHSEENASEQKSVETSLDELLHERNDMDLGDAHKESIFVQETVQMSKRESPKHHDDCEPRDVVFHDLKESLSEEKSPIVCEITETLENLNFKSEIGILEEADYEVQHSSFVKCEARSLELSAIDVGTTSEKKEEVESIDLETSETAVEEKVIAEHCPEIVSSIGGEKMPLLSKTISEDLVTTATDSGELSEGVVREEKSDANERVSEFDSDGFFAEYNEGLQVLNQLESGTKGAHIEDVDTLVSYIEGDAKTKIQTKIRKADKSRSRSRESRKKGSREEAAVHVEERIPPYSVSKMMMHHVALHPEYADAEITEDADDTGFKVVGKRKRKISFRRECVSENVNRSHSEENASEQKSVETSLDELLHERNDMDLGDAHKESIFVQETVQMSKRESPKHHDDCEPRDVVFHDLKESLSEEKSPIVCEITETLENLNFKSEIGILEEADYEVQHSSFVKCEARSLELSAIDVGTTSEKKEEVESIDLETSETAVEEKVIAEHCPEIVSSIGGEKMPLLSKTISEDLVTTATDSGELSEGVVREEKSDANERVSEFDSDGFFAEYNEGLQVLNQLESGTKGAHIEDVDTLVSYIEGDAKTKIQTKIRKADKSRSRSRESRKKGSREEAAVHVEERIPPYSVSKMMMHHVALHPEYADAEITEDADDTGFKVVGKRKRKISFRRECVSENVNRSHSEENASEQKSVETSLDELLHERNDMDLGDAHKESIFVQETVQMSKRESPKHHDDCEPRDVVFHDLKESLSEEKSPIVCEITETLENLNFKSEIGILEEADYEVQHSSFVKCEARSLELSAIDVGTTSEKKEEVESIDLETSETAVEEKVIAEHCPEIVSSIGGEKMPLLSKTISEDLVTTATDSGELSEGVVREEKSDANERVSEFDSDGFFAEYNEGLQVLNQLESGTKGAHIEDVDTLVSYIEGDAKTKIQTKIRKADKSRSRSRESRKKGSREEAAVHVEERIPPYSVSKMMMHHVALHPEYADAEITEDADDTGFKVVGKRKRKISFRRECVSENVNRSHSEENASEQKSVETSLDELLHERNDMDLGDAHKESIFVQETVQMSKRESPKHHDDCEPRDVVFHDLKESLSEEKSPIVCEITETLENLNFKSEIGILEEADYEVQHSSFVKCEARSLELSAIDVGTTSEKKEEVESIDLETSETAVEEKVIAEHCPEIVSSIGGEKMPLLSKTISEDLVTTATDSGELSEGVVREEKSDANERVSEFDSDGFFAEYNEGLQVLNQLESGTKGAHIEDVDTLVSYIEGDAKTKIQTKIRKADKSRSRSRESRKKGSREEAAVHVEERIPPYSVSKMMMHHVALHPEYADAEITEDADDTGFKVVGKRKRKISFRRECVSENVNRSHSEENASEQKSVETSLDELLHERNDMDLGDAHKESIFVQETVQMSKRESPKHHDDCEPRDVVFHDLKESLSEEKSPIVCEITETLENLNFKSEIGILEEADYEVQHSSFVKCEARSLELSAIDVGTTSEKKEEVESIDLETSETAVEEKVIAEHCPEIVSSIGGEKMPLLSKTISEDLVTTATDSGELSEGVVREEKSDANERVSEFDSDGFFAEYNEGLQVLNQLESGTKGAHIEDVDTLVSYIEGDAKTKIQTKIRKADKSRSRSRESRKKGSREEAAVHVEERIPPYSVSKMMMHHVALHPEYADAEITEDADDTGFKVVGKRKRKISFRRECVSENVNRSHSEENASEQKSVETSLDELLHERNDMDLGDAHKESIFVQETVQMSKRESPKHHDDCEPRDVVFHDLKESLSEEKSPIVCEITETLENLNFKSEIGILEEADYEVQHSSFVKCEARSLELSAIDVGTTSEKKEEVESIDLETSETAVEEKVIAEHCPEIVSSIGGEKMPLLSKTISEDLVTTATDSGELSEGVVREEKSDANERVSEFDSDGFFAEHNEGLQVLNQLESGTKGAYIEELKLSKHIPHHDCLLDMTPSVENFKLIEMSVKQCLFGDCSSNQPASLVSHCFYSSGQRLNNVARNDLCSFKESRKDISDYIESQDVNSSKNLYDDDDLSLLLQLHEAYYQQCPNSSIVENSNIGHSLSDYLFCSAAPCVENRAPFLYSSKASVFLSYDDFSEMNCLQFFGPSCPTVENLKTFVTHAKPSLIISSIDSFFVLQHASCSSLSNSYLHSGNGQPLEFAAAGISSSLIECLPTSPVNEKSVDENVPVTKSPQKEEIEVLKVEGSFCPEKSYMKDFYSDLSVRGQFGNLEFGCPKGCANCGEGDSVKSRRKRKSNKINSPSHNPSLECIDHDQDEQQTVELQRRYNMKLTHETTFTSCKMSVEPVCEGSTEIPLDSQNFDSLKQISLKVPSSRQKSKKRRSKHATQEASLKPTDIDQKQISSLVFDGMNVDQIFSPLVSESKFSKASAAMTYCPGLECDHELDRSEAYAGKRMKSIKKRKKKAEGIWISSQGPPPSDSGQESSKGHEVPLQNPQKRVKENKIRSALRKLAQEDPVSRNEKLVMVAGESTHRRK